MELNDIKDLLTQFDSSSLTEFELKQADVSLYMNKNEISQREVKKADAEITTPVVVEPNNTSEPSIPTTTSEVKDVEEDLEVITSPLVGVVYLKPAPDKENYKSIGDTVKKGEVVCIVEAMKVMNEITSPYDGTVAEICVANEDIVEYAQPIIKIK